MEGEEITSKETLNLEDEMVETHEEINPEASEESPCCNDKTE